jgi:hypothetical protein
MATKPIQPDALFSMLNIKTTDSPEKIINGLLSVIFWLPTGGALETNLFKLDKLDSNTIYMEAEVDKDEIANVLTSNNIRLPL